MKSKKQIPASAPAAQARAAEITKIKMTDEELERWAQRRHSTFKLPVNVHLAGIADGEQPDALLAEFLSEAIDLFIPELETQVLGQIKDDWEAGLFAEMLLIAKEINHYGLFRGKSGPASVDGACQSPMDFLLPGLSGAVDVKDAREVLYLLAQAIYSRRVIIQDRILTGLPVGIERIVLTEALVVAQAVVDRAEGDAEMEEWDRTNKPTALMQLAWKAKADYHRQRLHEIAEESRAALRAAEAEEAA